MVYSNIKNDQSLNIFGHKKYQHQNISVSTISRNIIDIALEDNTKTSKYYPKSVVYFDPDRKDVILYVPKSKFYFDIITKTNSPYTIVETPNIDEINECCLEYIDGLDMPLKNMQNRSLQLELAYLKHLCISKGDIVSIHV